MTRLQDSLAGIGKHYDKAIAGAVLVALLGSLLYLAFHVGRIRRMQERFQAAIDAMRPEHERARDEDEKPYLAALALRESPFAIPERSSSLFGPETRVWCVSCRWPIPYEAAQCPFCGAEQPSDKRPGEDRDGDGMKDAWETLHGLDPRDPADARADPDADGYPSIEEHDADPQTDPNDPLSHPPYALRLCLEGLKADPFDLRFMSVMGKTFQLNLRKGGRTYFAKLGDVVEGFTLAEFLPRKEEQTIPGIPGTREVDVSVLTLERGEKRIELVRGRDVQYHEYRIRLLFTVDKLSISATLNTQFNLREEGYVLAGINTEGQTVEAFRVSDRKVFTIRKCGENSP